MLLKVGRKKGEMKRKIEKFFIKFSNLVSFSFRGRRKISGGLRVNCWNSRDGDLLLLKLIFDFKILFSFLISDSKNS
jgi:hypothetical protein